MNANNYLSDPPVYEPDEVILSPGGADPPDLLLCMARSQKGDRERLVSARKMIALVVGALLAAALVAATFFWLTRSDSAYWSGEHKDARVDPKLPKPAVAKPRPPKVEAASQVATAKLPATIPNSKTTAIPVSVIQLGAYQSRPQAERAWTTLSARFPFLGKMDKLILPFRGGIRLRAAARSPGEAAQACDAMKGAGENCFLPR